MKRQDSNCIGILFDQGKAATSSNISEYTFNKEILQHRECIVVQRIAHHNYLIHLNYPHLPFVNLW